MHQPSLQLISALALACLGGTEVLAGAADVFFPSQATIVLLSGLPGDLESENNYRNQLQSWMEVAAASQPRSLVVLCDDTASVQIPPQLNGQALRGDREHFQGLSTLLSDASNVVVIAWGHGGRQGSTPVFHVRGPRLTPADFHALADKLPAAQSRWVLIFRGSGSFARELAGPGRMVVSSDFDSSFNSDPVEMDVLLKVIKNAPQTSFLKLTQALGPETEAWYQERHLARTEEPTLWIGNDKPQLLATAAAEKSATNTTDEPPQKSAPPGKKEETEPENLSAAWKNITPISPNDYPETDAVVLQRNVSYALAANPAISSEREEFIQVLTPEGKRFGDFDISYAPPMEEMRFLDCEVLGPDHKLTRLDPETIREERDESVGDYQLGRHKFFSLPGVVPGAVLHVRYRSEWRTFPLPHVSLTIPIAEELPIRAATLQVSIPKESAFHFVLEKTAASDPEIKQGTYGTTYSWHFKAVPPLEHEALSAPDDGARLLVSTFPDWPAFADWYGRISDLTAEVTPEIAAKAAELTRGATNDREKVAALYNYVTSLRYVAVPMGVNSFRPHAAAHVLANQFGDCKDKANLFNALLRALKIDAWLVLLPRFRQAYEQVPGLAFNHAISQVKLENQVLWVDTTDDICRFGLLPPGDPGRKVLVIDGKSHSLAELPRPQPTDHMLKLSGKISCADFSQSPQIQLDAEASGYPDYELRATAREATGRAASLPLLAASLQPVIGVFASERQTSTRVAALDENFSCRAEGDWVGGISGSGKDKRLVHSPFWMPKQWRAALHKRKTPLFLHEGYPLTLDEKFEFTLPTGSRVDALPGRQENPDGPLRWSTEWARVSHDKFSATLHAGLVHGDLSMDETVRFQKQLRQLLAALDDSASVLLTP